MGLSRNTVIQPTDFQLPVPQIPLELLASKLESAQLNKNEFDNLASVMPQYLQEHSADAQRYKQLVEKVTGDVSSAFASGDTGQAMRLLQQGKDFIRKQNQQGGLGYALQSAYNADAAAKAKLDETFKKDRDSGNNTNYQLAQMMYKVPELGYNPQTGNFNRPTAPNVPTYFDVDNELRDWLKSIDPQEYGFSRVQGDYVYTIEGKKYHIREFVPQFMNDPRVQQQLQLNSQFKYMQMSPEEKQDLIQTGQVTLDAQKAQVAKELATLEANLNSGDKKKVMEAQGMLASQGFNINGSEYGEKDVDGNAGPRTRMALEQMKQVVDKLSSKQFDENALQNTLYQEQVTGIGAKALAAKPDSETTKITGNNWRAQEAYKSSLRKKEQEEYLSKVAAMSTSVATPVPNNSLDFNAVDNLLKTTEESIKATTASLNTQFNSDPKLVSTFGTVERAVEFRKALEDNNGDINAAAAQVGVDPNLMQQAHSTFSDISYRGFAASALDLAETQKSKGQMELQQKEIADKYIERQGKGDVEQLVLKNKLDRYGVTADMIIANPQQAERILEENYRKENPMVQVKSTFDFDARRANENSGAVLRALKIKLQNISSKVKQDVQKDFDNNLDAYSSTISQGLRDNSEAFKGFNEAGASYMALPDEFGKFDWTDAAGNKVAADAPITTLTLEDITSSVKGKGQTLIYSGEAKSGDKTKKVTRRVYVGNNAEISDAVRNWGIGVVANAINNNDFSTALRAVDIAMGTDDLNRALKPSENNKKVFSEVNNGVSSHSSQPYNVIKSYKVANGNISLVTLGKPDNPSWAVVQDKGTHMEILESLTEDGKSGVYDNFDQAARTYKLSLGMAQGLFGKQEAKLKKEGISPVYPFNSNP